MGLGVNYQVPTKHPAILTMHIPRFQGGETNGSESQSEKLQLTMCLWSRKTMRQGSWEKELYCPLQTFIQKLTVKLERQHCVLVLVNIRQKEKKDSRRERKRKTLFLEMFISERDARNNARQN